MQEQQEKRISLSECVEAGIPVYKFGSESLAELHEQALGKEVLRGFRADGGWALIGDGWRPVRQYGVHSREYGWHMHGFRYVVDHGGFFTLNTILGGKVLPASVDLVH